MVKNIILNKNLRTMALFLFTVGMLFTNFAYGSMEEDDSHTGICVPSAGELKRKTDDFYNKAKKYHDMLKKNEKTVARFEKIIGNARQQFGSSSPVVSHLETNAAPHTIKSKELKDQLKKIYTEITTQLGSVEAQKMYEMVVKNDAMDETTLGKKDLIGLLIR